MNIDAYGRAQHLARYRKNANLKQEDAANFFQVSRTTISNWENAKQVPGDERRKQFVAYLLIKLEVGGEALQMIWVNLMAEVWDWPPLTNKDLPEGFLPLSPVPFQATERIAPFVGRKSILEWYEEQFSSGDAAPTAILEGPTGIGKSALATELAHTFRGHFSDGVLLVSKVGSNLLATCIMLAKAYEQQVVGLEDADTLCTSVRDLLSKKRALLIIDDAHSDSFTERLLPAEGLCTTVITTQRAGLLSHLVPRRFQLGSFDAATSKEFLLRSLQAANQSAEESLLEEIAELCGHHPFALSIIAGRLTTTPYPDAARIAQNLRYQQRQSFLQELTFHERSVWSAYNVVFDALPAYLQTFLPVLGVFEGDHFSAEAIAFVARTELGIAERYLEECCRRSLVETAGSGRYRLHVLQREYAKARLIDETSYWRMVSYYVDYAEDHEWQYERLDPEVSNVQAALELADKLKMGESYLRGSNAIFRILDSNGLLTTARAFLENAEKYLDAGDAESQAVYWSNYGWLETASGNLPKAQSHYERARALAESSGSSRAIALAFEGLGRVAWARTKSLTEAVTYWIEGLGLSRIQGESAWVCGLYQNLAAAAIHMSNQIEAAAYLQKGLELAETFDYRERIVTLSVNLASLKAQTRQYEEAKRLLSEALDEARRMDHKRNEVNVLVRLAATEIELKEFDLAKGHLLEVHRLAEEIDDSSNVAIALRNLGELYAQQSKYRASNVHFRSSLETAEPLENGLLTKSILCDWGHHLIDQKDFHVARRILNAANEIGVDLGDPELEGKTAHGLARLAAIDADLVRAIDLGTKSANLYREFDSETAHEIELWVEQLRRQIGNELSRDET